jgi:DNA helicase-2/ATP-dependent DNA helicase PcrA
MDQSDAEDLMQLSRAQLGFGDRKKRFPKKETLHHVYSRHVNTEIPVSALIAAEYPQYVELEEAFARIYADYVLGDDGPRRTRDDGRRTRDR